MSGGLDAADSPDEEYAVFMPSIDIEALIHAVGYPGLFAIVFAETGLLIGIFLPGDTLLITAGLVAQRGHLSVWWLVAVLILAAVLGDATGYYIGRRTGPLLFRKEEGRFFRRAHLLKAERFYDRHGGKTIVAARFIGFIRTFAPMVAGAAKMSSRRFFFFNAIGGVLWVLSLTWTGYALGGMVQNIELALMVLFGGAGVISFGPATWRVIKMRRASERAG